MATKRKSGGRQSSVEIGPGTYRITRPESAADVIDMIEKNGIQIVDLRFTDMPGLWQHFSISLPEVNEDLFTDGIGFDGSSIRGFQPRVLRRQQILQGE